MASHRQRSRRLRMARFHNTRQGHVAHVGSALNFPTNVRRSAMIVDEPTVDLDSMTRDELRTMAAERNIRGRSMMTKVALINALREHV